MKHQRQAAILRIVKSGDVGNQSELAQRLSREGFRVSQTTVSRDLKDLGLVRVVGPAGRPRYGTVEPDGSSCERDRLLRRLAPQFLLSAEPTGNMVVVRTSVGNAQGLAAAIDAAEIEGVAGTVAGDDTILVVCSSGVDSGGVRSLLLDYSTGKR